MRTEPSFQPGISSENIVGHDTPFLDDYRQRYGLSCDPFADDPHFPFYTGAQRRLILEKLVHLCQFSNNLLVVTGEYSTGKTRIAQALIDSLQDEDDICFLEGQINSRFSDLVDEIIDQFELESTDQLTDFFEKSPDTEGVAVIIIDDAHHLDDETLRELVLLMRGDAESRLRIIFLGEPLLLMRLEKLDVSHVAMTDFLLERFDLSEAVDYLNFRMEMADYLGPEIFTEVIVESWWRSANGQIDRLHACAQQKLLESVSGSSERNHLRGGFPVPHILAVAVLAAILIMWFFYFGFDSGAKKNEKSFIVSSSPSKEQKILPANVGLVSSAGSSAETESEAVRVEVPVSNLQPTESSSIDNPSQEKTFASAENEIKKTKSSVGNIGDGNELGVGTKRRTKSGLQVKPTQSVVTETSDDGRVSDKERVQSGDNFTEQEKTILSWDDSEHTIQIVGLSSEKSAQEFIAHQTNRNELLLFKTTRQGKDWYVVVYGHFATTAEAKAAVQTLPESQQKSTPWSRTVRIIKKEIRTR